MVMKDLSIILEEIKKASKGLNEAKQADITLITQHQKELNIIYYETKLNTLLFCADLDELNKYIAGLQLGFK